MNIKLLTTILILAIAAPSLAAESPAGTCLYQEKDKCITCFKGVTRTTGKCETDSVIKNCYFWRSKACVMCEPGFKWVSSSKRCYSLRKDDYVNNCHWYDYNWTYFPNCVACEEGFTIEWYNDPRQALNRTRCVQKRRSFGVTKRLKSLFELARERNLKSMSISNCSYQGDKGLYAGMGRVPICQQCNSGYTRVDTMRQNGGSDITYESKCVSSSGENRGCSSRYVQYNLKGDKIKDSCILCDYLNGYKAVKNGGFNIQGSVMCSKA